MHIEKIQQNNAPRVPELIMQALVKAIEDGHIRVGEDMPSERDLAEMLGVGRGSLRECLAILEFLGAIDSRGNRKVLLRDADYIQKARTWIECSNEMGGTEPFNEFRRVIEVGIVGRGHPQPGRGPRQLYARCGVSRCPGRGQPQRHAGLHHSPGE